MVSMGGRRPIVFRQVFRSSATKMSPAGPSHDNFLVLDFDPRSGLSFFREGKQRFRAECGEGRATQKSESLYPKASKAMKKSLFHSDSSLHARPLPPAIESIDDVMADIYRRMKPQLRLEIGLELWISARQMLLEALQSFHPEWTQRQVEQEAARRMFHESA